MFSDSDIAVRAVLIPILALEIILILLKMALLESARTVDYGLSNSSSKLFCCIAVAGTEPPTTPETLQNASS